MAGNGFTVDFSIKNFFFDRERVQDALTRSEKKVMSRIGAYIRTRARSSLRRRKAVSVPGQTPSVHSRDKFASLKNILFGYEPNRHTVVVGPVRFNGAKLTAGKTVPELMEFGGSARILEMRFKGNAWRYPSHWFRANPKRPIRPSQETRIRRVRYAARPFMAPALDEEIRKGTITEAWRASLTA